MMNKTDRERLGRIAELIDKFPFAQDGRGAKTASLQGAVAVQRDARIILPLVTKILKGMVFESIDTEENDIEEGWDYQAPDKSLNELEQWMNERSANGWE